MFRLQNMIGIFNQFILKQILLTLLIVTCSGVATAATTASKSTYSKDRAATTASAQGYTNLSKALSNSPSTYSAVSTYSSSQGWGYSVQKNEPYKSDSSSNSNSNSSPSPTPSLSFSQPASGYFDTVNPSTCTVAGWAYDPDNAAASITVHVYQDGRAGVGRYVTSCQANQSRPDVNSIIRIPGNHGFNCTLPVSFANTGSHALFIHAIDLNGTPNNLLKTNGKVMNCTGTPTSSTSAPVTNSPASATLSGADCIITSGISTCNSSMSWNIQNANNPFVRNITTNISYPDADKVITSIGRQIKYGANIVQALDGSTILESITVTAKCPLTAPWNNTGNVCFPTLNISAEKPLYRQNTTAKILWSMSDVIPVGYTCTVRGVGLNVTSVTTQTGSVQSGILKNKSEVILRCSNGTTTITDSTSIEVIPQVQEV